MFLGYYKMLISQSIKQSILKFYLRIQGNFIGENCTIAPSSVFNKSVCIGKNTSVGENVILHENVKIGANVSIHNAEVGQGTILDGMSSYFAPQKGDIKIGDFCHFSPFTNFEGSGKIKIGNHVSAGPFLKIVTHTGHLQALTSFPIGSDMFLERRPVFIEDNVYLGIDTTILMGVKIGRYSIISACSLVTKDVPPYSVVRGIPAKIIGNIKINDDGQPVIIKL